LVSYFEVGNRNQVHAAGLRAVDREELDLTPIWAPANSGIAVVRIAAARLEANSHVSKMSGLALNAREMLAVIDCEVVARVLAEG
jgi:hypothetical protein